MGSPRTRHVLLVLAAIAGGVVALRRRTPDDPVDVAPPSPPLPVTAPPPVHAPATRSQLPAPVELETPPPAPATPAPAWAQRRTAAPVERPSTRPSRRSRRAPLALAGITLAAVGLAVAVTLGGRGPSTPESPPTTAAVLGTQTPEVEGTTEPQATTESVAAPAALPRATAATPVRARGAALLPVPDARLAELEGARAQGRVVRVDEVVGDRVFWVGTREERLLVHLQGPGTRWAVRRGQRISFTGVVTRTPRGAPARWGVQPVEGRTRLVRQGHHLEVWGPDIRFDCVAQCRGS